MTGDEMERAIEFLLNIQSKLTADVQNLTNDVQELKVAQAQTSRDVSSLANSVAKLEIQAEIDRQEIREAINNLIVANEVTRDLAEKVVRL